MEEGLKLGYVVVMFPCYSETFVLREILELMRRGAQVTVLSLRNFNEKIVDQRAAEVLPRTVYSPYLLSVAILGANLYFLRRRFRRYLGIAALLFAKLVLSPKELLKNFALFPKSVYFARLMEERGVQHVHAHFTNYPATSAYIISRLTDIPFTMTAHAHDIFQNQLLLGEKMKKTRRLFAVSEYNRKYIIEKCPGITPDRVEVLHCGIDMGSFPYKEAGPTERRMILSAGRLMAIKGFDTLIRACAVLKKRGLSFHCSIIGDGPERSNLVRLITRYALGGVVELVGEMTHSEVLERMKSCDVFVLASRAAGRRSGVMDGIPVTLMEAMALGVPVVSCAVSGIPELVRHEETGLLVSPADSTRLEDAITRLLGDVPLRRSLSKSAREKVEKEFNIERSVDRLLEVFTERP